MFGMCREKFSIREVGVGGRMLLEMGVMHLSNSGVMRHVSV